MRRGMPMTTAGRRRSHARLAPASPIPEIAIDWLTARDAIDDARRRHDDPAGASRILIVNGSSRTEHTCPGEMSKSWRRFSSPTGACRSPLELSVNDREQGRRYQSSSATSDRCRHAGVRRGRRFRAGLDGMPITPCGSMRFWDRRMMGRARYRASCEPKAEPAWRRQRPPPRGRSLARLLLELNSTARKS